MQRKPPRNPTSHLHLRVMWIHTLGVTWAAVTGVEGKPCRGLLQHMLTGLWSTQAKVVIIMLKAALHWGSISNVINDPLGEPGHTALYVGLLSACGSMDIDHTFSPHFVAKLLIWGL